MSTALLIVGAGGNGRVIADVADDSGTWNRIAFLDDRIPDVGDQHPWPIVGTCDELDTVAADFTHVIVGFGDAALRASWLTRVESSGLALTSVRSSSAAISSRAQIGDGSVAMPRSVANIGVRTGKGCILNTAATVDHDCRLGTAVHVAPGASIGGNVSVGDGSWIGIGASVRQGIVIGRDVTVGAGAAVVTDLPDGCTAVGVPARIRD